MSSILFFLLLLRACFGISPTRVSNNLIYWTPHKTGSASMRQWLSDIATKHDMNIDMSNVYYPYSPHTDWHTRATTDTGYATCTLFGGALRVRAVTDRKDERELGRVVTTTRDIFDTVVSKYFYRMERKMDIGITKWGNDLWRLLFLYLNDVDPCDELRYYDGEEGCALERVDERIRKIVERIDCAVDVADADADLNKLCEMMGISDECPKMPLKNVSSNSSSQYKELKASEDITREMERVLKVSRKLREALMGKRCSSLRVEDRMDGGWPTKGCGSQK